MLPAVIDKTNNQTGLLLGSGKFHRPSGNNPTQSRYIVGKKLSTVAKLWRLVDDRVILRLFW